MRFYLGTHHPTWLDRTDVPLFISRRRLRRSRRLITERRGPFPEATCRWALDSGGYSELSTDGRWTLTAAEYAREVAFVRDEIGGLDWAAPMDWMCEENVLRKTGLTVAAHQANTVENFLRLRHQLGDLVIPVIQGWTVDEYERCVERYALAGVDLATERLVGVGSVCRRGQDAKILAILALLRLRTGLAIHAFGLRSRALEKASHIVASADSLAWSYRARRSDPLPGHPHKSCTNCLEFALRWREKQIDRLGLFHEEEVAA